MIAPLVLILTAAAAAAQAPAPAPAPAPPLQAPGQPARPPAAPAGQVPTTPPVVLPPRVGVATAAPQPLTIQDAVRMALEHNNDVAIARLAAQEARETIRAAEGIFDPTFSPNLTYQKATTATASAIGGAANGSLNTNTLGGTMEFDGRTPWQGGHYTFNFTSSRIETSNTLARLNPQFPSTFGASYVQPLFRGRAIDAERRQILISRRAADLTDAQLRQVVSEQLTLVEQSYWDLVFAIRNLQLQTTALSQAETQVQSNERQVQQGTLAPIDVVEAQTQVANFRQSVASAQQTLTEAENRLKALILADRSDSLWNQALLPTEPEEREVPRLTLDEAMALALRQRPELTQLEATRAQNAVDQRFFRDLARPQVNLVGSYSLAGLAGGAVTGGTIIGNATVPDFFIGGYPRSLDNLFSRRFPTAVVQMQVQLPVVNSTAQANVARVQIAGTQIERQHQQLEQAIEVDVRNALQAVETSRERLNAASSARRNAQEQYQSEQRRFDSGLSVVFLVLERQTALVTAFTQELRARADLNQAIALLDRATGSTLDRHHVEIEAPQGQD
jgi:HAE1 family hydrophobic/amphiphilic exporter-1